MCVCDRWSSLIILHRSCTSFKIKNKLRAELDAHEGKLKGEAKDMKQLQSNFNAISTEYEVGSGEVPLLFRVQANCIRFRLCARKPIASKKTLPLLNVSISSSRRNAST